MTLYLQPDLSDIEDFKRRTAEAVNDIRAGNLDCVNSVTLTASTTSTVISDNLVSVGSVILLMPKTANAAAAIATTYISSRNTGTFTITHANNAQTDRHFDYVVIG